MVHAVLDRLYLRLVQLLQLADHDRGRVVAPGHGCGLVHRATRTQSPDSRRAQADCFVLRAPWIDALAHTVRRE